MTILKLLFITLALVVNVLYYYNVIISLFSLKKPKSPHSYDSTTKESFCILIPCHNEEDAIQNNLTAISNCSYDKDLFTTYVIADNCTDSTVDKVKEFKLSHSDMNIEILEVKGGTKPKAINSAISILKEHDIWYTYDNIVFLDSDNKMSPQMLESFNHYHKQHPILQCRIASDNHDNIVSKSFASAFANMRYSFQIARNNIGLSGSLCGTGFSVNREVFDKVGFDNCTTLTEDLEFSVKSIINGYKIKYIDEQYVLNQNLTETRPSITQRVRWCNGHMQTLVKLTPSLIKAFFKKPSFQLLDTFIFLSTPAKSIVYIFMLILQFILFFNGAYIKPLIFFISLLYQVIFCLYCNDWKISYIIPFIKYGIEMLFIIPYGTITYKRTTWVKTKHKNIK